jgi:probable F420-dependent oxidoreductase
MTATDTPATRMPIGRVGIWTGSFDVPPMAEARELAAEVESLGYSAVWIPEVAGRDPLVLSALLLASTTRLVMATGIASIWARDAVAMVEGHRTLTEAFPERFLLGLGVSHHTIVQGVRGHQYDKPLQAMAAYLDAMEKSPFTGQRPTTPPRVVLAALRPRMLALAGERTDGAHPYFVPAEHTALAREALGPQSLLCPEQAVLLETDPARAREIGRKHTAIYVRLPNYANSLRRFGFDDTDFADGGSDRLIDAIVAWGSEDAIVARVKGHLDAGADHVCVQMITERGRDVPIDAWRTLAPALTSL